MVMISDFKLSASMLKRVCRSHGVDFVDIPVVFDSPQKGCIYIEDSKNISHTLYKIVSEYIKKAPLIVGKELFKDIDKKEHFLLSMANSLRYFMYKDNKFYSQVKEPHSLRLYQRAMVWILLKDIICPLYDKKIENIKIVCGESEQIDIAKYFKKGEASPESEVFIFINNIDNMPVQNAFLFVEALKSLDLSPIEVLKKIYEGQLLPKFKGLLDMALSSEEEIKDFENTLFAIIDMDLSSLDKTKQASCKIDKIAQSFNPYGGMNAQWWTIGLIEQMLERTRGSDWSSFEGIQNYVEEFWDKVEDVRQKRVKNGHDDGVPFNVLLSLKSKQTVGYKPDVNMTLQGLLSSDRVW